VAAHFGAAYARTRGAHSDHLVFRVAARAKHALFYVSMCFFGMTRCSDFVVFTLIVIFVAINVR
jgi:hypothetical protein